MQHAAHAPTPTPNRHVLGRSRVAFLAGAAAASALAVLWASNRAVPVRTPGPGSTAIICDAEEPGLRVLIVGTAVDEAGRPVPEITVDAYNADASGLYNRPSDGTRVPRIRGSVRTDSAGRFQILTVMPGPYPSGDEPAHVHFGAVGPGYALSFRTIWFEGDPLITSAKRDWAQRDDETEIVPVERTDHGLAVVRTTIVLRGS